MLARHHRYSYSPHAQGGLDIVTRVAGNTDGLKANQLDALERIYRRAIPTTQVITTELAQYMASVSREIRRQVGVLVDRRGRIAHVVVGDTTQLKVPELGRHRAGHLCHLLSG